MSRATYLILIVVGFLVLSGCQAKSNLVQLAVEVDGQTYAGTTGASDPLLVRRSINGKEETLSFSPSAGTGNNVSIAVSRLNTSTSAVAGTGNDFFESLETIDATIGGKPETSSTLANVKVAVSAVTSAQAPDSIGPIVGSESELDNTVFLQARRGSRCSSLDGKTVMRCACGGCMIMTSRNGRTIDHILCCGTITQFPRLLFQ